MQVSKRYSATKFSKKIRTFLRKCVKNDQVITKKKWKPSPQTCMTKHEAKKMFQAAEKRKQLGTKAAVKDWIFIHLGFSSGLRASEIAALNCHHIELENNENPNIFVETGKTIHSRRRVPLDPDLVNKILEYYEYKRSWGEHWQENEPFLRSSHGEHYRRENLYIMFKRVLKLATTIQNPQRFYTHSMRHTFAVRVYKQSKHNVELVRQLLGHSSIEVTMAYLAAFNCEKIQAVKGLYR